MGAFLVRYWSTQIHFFYLFGFMIHGTFSAPAWAMLPIWFVEQLFLAMVPASSLPGGGVAYWAHVGGFAFGVGTAMVMRHYKIEERYIHPAIDAQVNITLVHNETVDRALEAQAAGDTETAFTLLAAEVRRQPANREAALALWQVAAAQDRASEAAPALLRIIREQLRCGEVKDALNLWLDLVHAVPGVKVEPLLLVRLARALSESGHRDQAVAALRLALLDPDDALTAAMALRISREAREVDEDLARGAARLALSRGRVCLLL